MKRAGVAGIALRAGMYLIIRIDGVSVPWWAFGGGYEKAANPVAGLSFDIVVEAVLFKPDDLDAEPVIHFFDALLELCQLITDKHPRGLLHVTH
ncbi:hypothetical protein SME13J_23910 [Serratia marcescens]|nr:hypothetical protein SME13J_23910 [Serratia marcescens]